MKYRKKNELNFNDLWEISNILYILKKGWYAEVYGHKNMFEEIIAENVPDLMKILGTEIQEVQPT